MFGSEYKNDHDIRDELFRIRSHQTIEIFTSAQPYNFASVVQPFVVDLDLVVIALRLAIVQ